MPNLLNRNASQQYYSSGFSPTLLAKDAAIVKPHLDIQRPGPNSFAQHRHLQAFTTDQSGLYVTEAMRGVTDLGFRTTPSRLPYDNTFWRTPCPSPPSQENFPTERTQILSSSRSTAKPVTQLQLRQTPRNELQCAFGMSSNESQHLTGRLSFGKHKAGNLHQNKPTKRRGDREPHLTGNSSRAHGLNADNTLSRAHSTDNSTSKKRILQKIGIHSPTHKRVAPTSMDLSAQCNQDCVPSKAAKVLGTGPATFDKKPMTSFASSSLPARTGNTSSLIYSTLNRQPHEAEIDISKMNEEADAVPAKSMRKLSEVKHDPRLRTLNERLSSIGRPTAASPSLRYYENELPPTPPSKPSPIDFRNGELSRPASPRKARVSDTIPDTTDRKAPPTPITALVEAYRDRLTMNDKGADIKSWHGDIQRVEEFQSPPGTTVCNHTPQRNLLPPDKHAVNFNLQNGVSPSIYSGGPWSPLSPETRAMFYPPPLSVPQQPTRGNSQAPDDKGLREVSYSSASASIPLYYDSGQRQNPTTPTEDMSKTKASRAKADIASCPSASNQNASRNSTHSIDSYMMVLNDNLSRLIEVLEKSHNETNDRVHGLEVNVNMMKETLGCIQSSMLNLEAMLLGAINPASLLPHATWPSANPTNHNAIAQGGWHARPPNSAPVTMPPANSRTQAYFGQLGQGLHSAGIMNGRTDLGIHPSHRGE